MLLNFFFDLLKGTLLLGLIRLFVLKLLCIQAFQFKASDVWQYYFSRIRNIVPYGHSPIHATFMASPLHEAMNIFTVMVVLETAY